MRAGQRNRVTAKAMSDTMLALQVSQKPLVFIGTIRAISVMIGIAAKTKVAGFNAGRRPVFKTYCQSSRNHLETGRRLFVGFSNEIANRGLRIARFPSN
jgi:hypothetical protein